MVTNRNHIVIFEKKIASLQSLLLSGSFALWTHRPTKAQSWWDACLGIVRPLLLVTSLIPKELQASVEVHYFSSAVRTDFDLVEQWGKLK